MKKFILAYVKDCRRYESLSKSFLAIVLLGVTVMLLSTLVAPLTCIGAGLVLWGDGSKTVLNKVGLDVFFKGKFGQVKRMWLKPRDKKSVKQLSQRALMSSISKSWRTLTVAQINAWNAYALIHPFQGKVGDTVTYSGEQCFVQTNLILQTASLATISDPPHLSVLWQEGIFSCAGVAGTSLSVSFASPLPATSVANLFATAGYSKGRRFNENKRFIGIIPASSTYPMDVTTPYGAVYGSIPPANYYVRFWVQPVYPDGNLGPYAEAEVLL